MKKYIKNCFIKTGVQNREQFANVGLQRIVLEFSELVKSSPIS